MSKPHEIGNVLIDDLYKLWYKKKNIEDASRSYIDAALGLPKPTMWKRQDEATIWVPYSVKETPVQEGNIITQASTEQITPEEKEIALSIFRRFTSNDDGTYCHYKNKKRETYYIPHSREDLRQFCNIKKQFIDARDIHNRRKTIITAYALRYTDFCKLNADSRRKQKRISEQFKELVEWMKK